MFRHYLHITLKHLWKRRLYSFITLLSLTLGLSVFSLIFLHVKRELSFNKGWQDSAQIHRVMRQEKGSSAWDSATEFKSTELVELARYLEDWTEGYTELTGFSVGLEGDDLNRGFSLALIDESYFRVFGLQVLEGSLEQVIQTPGLIALDRKTAEIALGKKNSYLGLTVELSGAQYVVMSPDFVAASPAEFEVGAIYELPEPVTSSVGFGGLARRSANSEKLIPTMREEPVIGTSLWLKLPADISAAQVEQQLVTFVDEYSPYKREIADKEGAKLSEFYRYWLHPMEDFYFSEEVYEYPSGDMGRVITFSIVGIFVLLAGCSNAISLGLAGILERRREVGIRKAVGALPGSIAMQYLGEAMTLALLAMVPALLLTHWLHPTFANLLSITDMPKLGMQEISLLLAIAAAVGLLNGFYPAAVLARVKPVSVLKAQTAQPRIRKLNARSLLVGAQFTISIMLLIGTLGLYTQLYATRQQPLGFDSQNMAMASVNFQAMLGGQTYGQTLLERLKTVPGIRDGSSSFLPPSRRMGSETTFVTDQQQSDSARAFRETIPWEYMKFMGVPLLAGREFEQGRDVNSGIVTSADEVQATMSVVINRTAMKVLGFSSPEQALNNIVYMRTENGPVQNHSPLEIIGVVEDSKLGDIRSRPAAAIYSLADSGTAINVLFRYDDAIAGNLQELVNEIWVEVTGYPAGIRYVDDVIDQVYAEEQRESELLLICAGLALFLSCVGLYGLVSVAMRAQVKEIGVRKALGATTTNVVFTYLKRFSVPVLLANVVAWPVAAYFVLQWIQRFPYQMDAVWLLPICIVVSVVVTAITWLTVGSMTYKAASARPVKSLRYE